MRTSETLGELKEVSCSNLLLCHTLLILFVTLFCKQPSHLEGIDVGKSLKSDVTFLATGFYTRVEHHQFLLFGFSFLIAALSLQD